MTDMTLASFETFLVEDVILTLGTLRGALGWIADGGEPGRAGIERLERQLAWLEDRARALCSDLAATTPAPPPHTCFGPLAGGATGLPVFRSCRA
ncbi:MAG: hypothetical protein KDE00_14385 [Rhodobacteraceae bacterium]|nr:hypothetical protein [Paracoccaceae bacterium]